MKTSFPSLLVTLSLLAFASATTACSANDAPTTTTDRKETSGLAASTSTCTEGADRLADDGCNTCTCSSSGTWQCTELACIGEVAGDGDTQEPKPEDTDDCTQVDPDHCEVSSEDGNECVDGDMVVAEDGCNTCTCSGGAWACTELACAR